MNLSDMLYINFVISNNIMNKFTKFDVIIFK